MKKKVLLYICFALISIGGYSQISTDEIPPSFYLESLDSDVSATDHHIATRPSLELIAKEDREDQEKGLPPRFGYPIDAGLNLPIPTFFIGVFTGIMRARNVPTPVMSRLFWRQVERWLWLITIRPILPYWS